MRNIGPKGRSVLLPPAIDDELEQMLDRSGLKFSVFCRVLISTFLLENADKDVSIKIAEMALALAKAKA